MFLSLKVSDMLFYMGCNYFETFMNLETLILLLLSVVLVIVAHLVESFLRTHKSKLLESLSAFLYDAHIGK